MEDEQYEMRIVQHEITIERKDSGEHFMLEVSTKDGLFHAKVMKHTLNGVMRCSDKLPLVTSKENLEQSVRSAIDAHLKCYHPPPRKKHLTVVGE